MGACAPFTGIISGEAIGRGNRERQQLRTAALGADGDPAPAQIRHPFGRNTVAHEDPQRFVVHRTERDQIFRFWLLDDTALQKPHVGVAVDAFESPQVLHCATGGFKDQRYTLAGKRFAIALGVVGVGAAGRAGTHRQRARRHWREEMQQDQQPGERRKHAPQDPERERAQRARMFNRGHASEPKRHRAALSSRGRACPVECASLQ
jgi:hypothetical protein